MKSFDALAKECKETMSVEDATKTLWTEVFSLEKVIVLVYKPGNKEEEKYPRLCMGELEGSPSIFAFTDKEHYKEFEKSIASEDEDSFIEYREITINELLNLSVGIAKRNIPFVTMNYGNEYVFHAPTKNILPMYRRFIKGEIFHTKEYKKSTKVSVFIPEKIEDMKTVLNEVKGNFTNMIHHVSPISIRLEGEVQLTLVIKFNGELPFERKEIIMENLHKELLKNSVLFPTDTLFTEASDLVLPNMSPIVTVIF